jgi:Rrf2 family protein
MAVHVLVLLADRAPEPVSSEQAAGSVGTNPVHIRRVMSSLRNADIVASRSGAGGGWTLGRAPERIRLDQVWESLFGDEQLVALHPEPNPACPIGREIGAVLNDVSERVTHAALAELGEVTLADLLTRTQGTKAKPTRRANAAV